MKLNPKKTISTFVILFIFCSVQNIASTLPIIWGEEKTDSLGPNSSSVGNLYHSTFHYDLVKLLAIKAGFSKDTAEIIARYSTLTDQINPKMGYPNDSGSLKFSSIFPSWSQSIAGTERFSSKINNFGEFSGVYWHSAFRDKMDSLAGAYVYAPFGYPIVTDTKYHADAYYWRIPFSFTLTPIEKWALYGTNGVDGLPQDAPDTVRYFDVASSKYKPVPKGSLIALAIFLHSLADSYSHEKCMMEDTLRGHPAPPSLCGILWHWSEIPYTNPTYAFNHTEKAAQATWRVLREYKRIHNINTPAIWTTDNNGFEDGDGIPDELEDNYNADHTESFIEKWKSPAVINLNPTFDTIINHFDHTTLRIQLVEKELAFSAGIEPLNNIDNYFQIVSLFPNPAENSIELNFSMAKPGKVVAKIYDITGKTVFTKNVFISDQNNSKLIFDLKEFTVGTYSLSLESRGVSTSMAFIKK